MLSASAAAGSAYDRFIPSESQENTGRHRARTAVIALAACSVGVLLGAVGAVLLAPFWHSQTAPATAPVLRTLHDEGQPWDYKGFERGDWADVGYPLCDGKQDEDTPNNQWQSPINLPNLKNVHHPDPAESPTYNAAGGGCRKFVQSNNPHTWETEFVSEGCTNLTMKWKGKNYTMQQFHFHVESENKVDMEHRAGEMHLVHQAADGSVLVVGVFLKLGPHADKLLKKVFSYKYVPEMEVDGETPLNPYPDLLRDGLPFYSYLGSFTTPPCTPNVEWISLVNSITIEEKVLDDFKKYLKTQKQPDSYGMDYRPVQPLNGRSIKLGHFH